MSRVLLVVDKSTSETQPTDTLHDGVVGSSCGDVLPCLEVAMSTKDIELTRKHIFHEQLRSCIA
jgi:hypothetical protein